MVFGGRFLKMVIVGDLNGDVLYFIWISNVFVFERILFIYIVVCNYVNFLVLVLID